MSAASLAMSTALSTLMPISAARSAGASLMPSPRKPTTLPCARSSRTSRSLCSGVSRANTRWRITVACTAASSMHSICGPVTMRSAASPTCAQTRAVTSSLSPVNTLTSTPCAARACNACAVDSLGGSRKAT
ncbi:hypothetical protein D3C71_1462790 [compost metagenome]